MNLIQAFQDFIEKENLTDQKLLCMVSGGVDSMVLLAVALQVCEDTNLAVFHLDHGTREESNKDLEFVQNYCSKNKITFYGKTLNRSYDQNQEKSWRIARQKLSAKAAEMFGAQRILTAHHATDLAETMIFRLTKGTGPSGLAPFDIRTKPFWNIPKTDLVQYAQTHKLVWREDCTNNNIVHERNLIRHAVLPVLRKITPNLEKVFVQESQLFNDIDNYLTHQAGAISLPLSLKDFLQLPAIIQKTWLREISETTPSLGEINDCLDWLTGNPAGNTRKTLGNIELKLKDNQITLQSS